MTKDFDETHEVQSCNNDKSNFKISRKPSSKPLKKVILETSIYDAVPKEKTKRTISRKKPEHYDAIASLNDVKEIVEPPKQTFVINPDYSFLNSPSVFESFDIEITSVENEVKASANPISSDISPLYKRFSFGEPSYGMQNAPISYSETKSPQLPNINEQILEFQKKSLDSIQNLYTNIVTSHESIKSNEITNKTVKQDKELKDSIEKLTNEVVSLSNKISDLEKQVSTAKVIEENIKEVKSIKTEVNNNKEIKMENQEKDYTVCDNETLLIDEITQKVYLPYTFDELMIKMFNNPNYLSIEEVIEKEYTLPLYLFKNPIRSRFKESYRLMRLKEQAPISEALSLAAKLMFNSSLNPAVIRACNSIGELNLYLIALYKNEIDEFKPFKVVYNSLPTIK